MTSALLGVGAAQTIGTKAAAGDLVYTPINPSFGGNAFNSAHLLGLANAQNEPKQKEEQRKEKEREAKTTERASTSNFDRFMQQLQSRLYSSLASAVSKKIFGEGDNNEGAEPSGTIKLDDQEISWLDTGIEIQVTVTDLITLQTTEIIVPKS